MAAFGVTTTSVLNDTLVQMTDTCGTTNDVQQDASCKFRLGPNCSGANINCQNVAKSRLSCSLEQTVDAANKALVNVDSKVKSSLLGGLSENFTDTQVKNKLREIMTAACGDANKVKQTLDTDVDCDAKNIVYNTANSADAVTTCYIQALGKALNDAEAKVKSETSSQFDLGLGGIIGIIVAVVVVAIIIGVVVKVVQSKKHGGGGGSAPAAGNGGGGVSAESSLVATAGASSSSYGTSSVSL